MLEHIETVFDDMKNMLKGLKKKSYETRMRDFRERNSHFFREMIEYTEKSGDRESAAKEIADVFTAAVEKRFSVNGKMKSRTQADLNFFMIYFVFPALLLEKNENCVLLADSIRDAWRASFRESEISYTDYDKLYGAFHEKIFGIL